MIFSRCYDYRVWFWGFSDDNIRFADKLPILWLITRKILRQNVSKYFIGMFYVVSDRYSTEHRGWELNTEIHTFWIIFCKSYPQERKNYPWLSFFIKIQSEMKFLWSDLSSYASITKNIEDPIIMIHLLNLNQNWISVNFWHRKWRCWYKFSPLIKCKSQ